MAKNVFNASGSARVIKADKAIVTLDKQPMLALGVTIQYGRPVQQLPVLAEEEVLSIGKPSGTISIDALLISGADADITKNSLLNSDGCDPAKALTITYGKTEGACASLNKPVTCKNCVASAVTVNAQGGRGYIATGVQIVFTAMSFD